MERRYSLPFEEQRDQYWGWWPLLPLDNDLLQWF
jgi:hypothetical protein